MKTSFKISQALLSSIRQDLHRAHPFAFERVGFIACSAAYTADGLIIMAYDYEPVPDDEYLRDSHAGAMMGSNAIRRGMNLALNRGKEDVSVFHVHQHYGAGIPRFSGTDTRETAKFVPDFFHAAQKMPHGALILSDDRATGRIWIAEDATPLPLDRIMSVGMRTEFLHIP